MENQMTLTNNHTISPVRRKLFSTLNAAEEQHPFNKKNFVSMNSITFLWIIGEMNNDLEELLKQELRQIVNDVRSVRVIHSQMEEFESLSAGENLYQKFYDGIERASRNYLNIDLNHPVICPIFMSGCFQKENSSQAFTEVCLTVQRALLKRHRYAEWSPFLLYEDENVDETACQFHGVQYFMNLIMKDSRDRHYECCHPCCVISDVNQQGMAISAVQAAKTIVMLSVFRNSSCQNEELMESVIGKILEGEKGNWFFTARAVSICEPVQSIMLNRLLAVHRIFMDGITPQTKLFENWTHKFYKDPFWKKRLENIPHDENYNILTAPIYSTIPIPDSRMYTEYLMEFCRTYYLNPLYANPQKVEEEWWLSFYEEYFLLKAGSVESLDVLEEHLDKILEKVPALTVQSMNGFLQGDLRSQCEGWLVQRLRSVHSEIAENATQAENPYMSSFRQKKQLLNRRMEEMENEIRNQIKRLKQSELLLTTGGVHISDPEEDAHMWMKEYSQSDGRKISDAYFAFQKMICEYFQNKQNLSDELYERVLDLYGRIVSGSIESREKYMATKLNNLAVADMGQLIQKLGESWLYPIRLLEGTDQGAAQKLYIMGNEKNYLYRKILDQKSYMIASKVGELDDRLEIVRVSDRMTPKQIIGETGDEAFE